MTRTTTASDTIVFPTNDAAAAVMGALYQAKRIGSWSSRRTAKGVTVRYQAQNDRGAWFDLKGFDMDRFFPASAVRS